MIATPQLAHAGFAALDEHVEPLARGEHERARLPHPGDGPGVFRDHVERVAAQPHVEPPVGGDVGQPPQLRLALAKRDLGAELPVHDGQLVLRCGGRDLRPVRTLFEADLLEGEHPLLDVAELGRQQRGEPVDDHDPRHAAVHLAVGDPVHV